VIPLLLALALVVPQDDAVTLRGKPQHVRLYGPSDGTPVVVVSGDGGWIHLAPHVAEVLAARGFFVVGVDAKAYLSSFTHGTDGVMPADVGSDFARLVDRATVNTGRRPVVVGVSEGAALAVLAATSRTLQPRIAGVVALGLGDTNELAWRWQDSVIYMTKGIPNEPTFSVAAIVGRVAPVPLAMIQSTRDEYVSTAESDRIYAAASQPKRLWRIAASNHRFSDNLGELDRGLQQAFAWIRSG
jgi:alpha-beta hydrolase superfamily lysophospholipase